MQEKFTEIASKITMIKSGLANAITDKGIETDSNASFNTMIDNIGAISGEGNSNLPISASRVISESGKSQEEINQSIYGAFNSEIVSSGEDITVDDVIGDTVSSIKLEGNTVKNIVEESEYNNSNLYGASTYIDDYYIDCKTNIYCMTKLGNTKFEVGKTYTLLVEIKENTLKSNTWANTKCVFNFAPKAGDVGIFKLTTTVKSMDDVTRIFYFTLGSDFDASTEKIVYRFMVVEGDGQGVDKFFVGSGLKSSKAIVTNNGERYEFYASEKDKQEGRVIELHSVGGISDKLEVFKDGTGSLTKNVTVYNQFSGCYQKKSYDDIYVVEFGKPPLTAQHMNKVISNKLKTVNVNEFPNEEFVYYTGYYLVVGVFKSRLKEETAKAVLEYLNDNDYCIMIPSKETNDETFLPRDLIPAMPAQSSNTFSFGDEVKPSKASAEVSIGNLNHFVKPSEIESIKNEQDQLSSRISDAENINNDHDACVVDLYEMVLISATTTQRAKMSISKSITDSYARLIINGVRDFESVPDEIKQAISETLIDMGRADLTVVQSET